MVNYTRATAVSSLLGAMLISLDQPFPKGVG